MQQNHPPTLHGHRHRFDVGEFLGCHGPAAALAFLWPALYTIRNGALLLFVATVFAVAPVAGFGWLLATLGLAQCIERERAARIGYVALFALIFLYRELPWAALLLD